MKKKSKRTANINLDVVEVIARRRDGMKSLCRRSHSSIITEVANVVKGFYTPRSDTLMADGG